MAGGNGDRPLFTFRVRHLAIVAALASPGGWAAWNQVTSPDEKKTPQEQAQEAKETREIVAHQVEAQLAAGWSTWIERERVADEQVRALVGGHNGLARALRDVREELAEALKGAAKRRVNAVHVPDDLSVIPRPEVPHTPDEARRRDAARP